MLKQLSSVVGSSSNHSLNRGESWGCQASINFVYSPEGAAQFFPEEYETFVKALPMKERNDIIGSYAKRLDSTDPKVRIKGWVAPGSAMTGYQLYGVRAQIRWLQANLNKAQKQGRLGGFPFVEQVTAQIEFPFASFC